MMKNISHAARWAAMTALLVGALASTARAGFDKATYPPSKLAAIVAKHVHHPVEDSGFEGAIIKHSVKVAWTGRVRELSDDERRFMTGWGKMWGHDPSLPAMFQRAVEVKEGEAAYWLPIQQQILPGLQRDVTAGETIRIYILFAGDIRGVPMALVSAFDTKEDIAKRRR